MQKVWKFRKTAVSLHYQTNKNIMTYSKKFQTKKVLVANVAKIIEAATYNELNTEKDGIEILYFDDVVEGVKFTYTNTTGQIVSTTFRKVGNMDGTLDEEWDEQNDDDDGVTFYTKTFSRETFSYSAVNQANQNLSDYAIVAVTKTMLKRYKRYAKK